VSGFLSAACEFVCGVCGSRRISFCRSRARFGGSVTAGRGSRNGRGCVQVDEFSAFVLHVDGVVRWWLAKRKWDCKDDDVRAVREREEFVKPAQPFSTPSLLFRSIRGSVRHFCSGIIVFPAPE
jgi:hypothetical protein